jgi:HEAT repeat protein
MGLWQSTKAFVATARLKTTFDRSSIIQDLGKSHDAASYSNVLIDVLLHDPKYSLHAAESLGWLGSEKAVEPLAQTLRHSTDKQMREVCARALLNISSPKAFDVARERALYDPAQDVRAICIQIVEKVGNKETTLPILVDIIAREQSAQDATQATAILGKLGDKSVVPVLDKIMLTHNNESLRETAFYALRTLSPDTTVGHLMDQLHKDPFSKEPSKYLASMGKEAVAPLIAGIERDTSENKVYFPSQRILAEIAAPDATPLLIDAMAHENQIVRWSAAEALGNMPESREIFDVLSRAALHDNNDNAVNALNNNYFTNATSRFLELVDNPANDPKDRARAIDILVSLECKNPAIIANALSDKEFTVRYSAAMAMEKMGTTEQVPILIQRLAENSSAVIRGHIIKSLGNIEDDRAAEPLIALLRDNKSNDQLEAVRALGKIGNKSAVPEIIRLADTALSSEFSLSTLVKRSSIEALVLLQDSRAVPTLNKALESLDSEIRAHASKGLCTMGNEETVPALLARFGDIDKDVRLNVVEAIGHHKAANQAIAPLIAMMKYDSDAIKIAAMNALENSGGEDAIVSLFEAVPKTPAIRSLGDFRFTINPALSALSSIIDKLDPATAPAGLTNAVVPFLGSDNEDVRDQAIKTLGKIGNETHIATLIQKPMCNSLSCPLALKSIYRRSDLTSLTDVATIPSLINSITWNADSKADKQLNQKLNATLDRLYCSKERLREAILTHPTMTNDEKINVWGNWNNHAGNNPIETTAAVFIGKIPARTIPFNRDLGDIYAVCEQLRKRGSNNPSVINIANGSTLLRGANEVDPNAKEELLRAAMPAESTTAPNELMRPSAPNLTPGAQAQLDAEKAKLTHLSPTETDNANNPPKVEFFDASRNPPAQTLVGQPTNPPMNGAIDLSAYAATLASDGSMSVYAAVGCAAGVKKPLVRT